MFLESAKLKKKYIKYRFGTQNGKIATIMYTGTIIYDFMVILQLISRGLYLTLSTNWLRWVSLFMRFLFILNIGM